MTVVLLLDSDWNVQSLKILEFLEFFCFLKYPFETFLNERQQIQSDWRCFLAFPGISFIFLLHVTCSKVIL